MAAAWLTALLLTAAVGRFTLFIGTAAAVAYRTADALCTPLLGFDHIPCRCSNDQRKDDDDDKIYHTGSSFPCCFTVLRQRRSVHILPGGSAPLCG